MQLGLSAFEPAVWTARDRCAPVARRRALVRGLPRTYRNGGATGLLGGRPAVHPVERVPAIHVHHRLPRRRREREAGARLVRCARYHRTGRTQPAPASKTGAAAAVCAPIGRSGGARQLWICTTAWGSTWSASP